MTRALAAAVVCCLGTAATAHDLWLIPPATAGAGKAVTIWANVGMDFPKGETAPDTSAYLKRIVVNPDGTVGQAVAAGKDGESGLMTFTPKSPGVYVVAVQTKARVLTLDAAAFNEYLVSGGLPHIYRLRAKEKSLDQPGKERYSKSPKVLVKVGEGKGDATMPVGLPLEIVPLADPFALKVGHTLKVRVLFEGKPLADANLGWDHPGDGEPPSGTVRSDAKGEAMVPIASTGLMTIRLTHMTRPKAAEYEWESFWTTLTWVVPE
jgi:uncharacterized GH25 family protein